jgi:hypothetical protein
MVRYRFGVIPAHGASFGVANPLHLGTQGSKDSPSSHDRPRPGGDGDARTARKTKAESEGATAGVPLSNDAFVWSTQADGLSPRTPNSLTRAFHRLCRTMESETLAPDPPRVESWEFRFHDLRHLSATEMVGQWMDPRTVAARLAHANPSVTLARPRTCGRSPRSGGRGRTGSRLRRIGHRDGQIHGASRTGEIYREFGPSSGCQCHNAATQFVVRRWVFPSSTRICRWGSS